MKRRNRVTILICLLSITSLLFLTCKTGPEPDWSARFSDKALKMTGTPVIGAKIELSTAEILGDQPTLHYKWMHGDSMVDNGTIEKITVSNLQFSDSGDYWCIVSNDWGSDNLIVIFFFNQSKTLQPRIS